MTAEKKKMSRHFFFSLLIHVLVIAGLAAVAVRVYQERNGKSNSTSGEAASKPQAKPQEINDTISQQDAAVEQMAPAARMSELRKKSAELGNINPADVNTLAGAVETAKGADTQRAYEPVKNVPGKFDPNTATISDIVREERGDQPVFIYTLVDAEGHSMTVERKMEEMSTDDMRAYQVFSMSRNNKNMSRLLKAAIKIGQTQVDEKAEESTPTSEPAK